MATIEDYICEHLAKPLRLKDGSQVLNDDARHKNKKTGAINTDHKYMGVRFYFEDDNIWTTKIR